MSISNNTPKLQSLLEKINALPEASSGIELPELSNAASAGDILSGKEAIDNAGNIITGTIATVEQATPSITMSEDGFIEASATQTAGYVASGTRSATKSLTITGGAITITPSTSTQTAVASGVYTTGAVTVAGDSNLVAENIKSGVSIFNVEGSLSSSLNGSYTLVNGSSTAIIEFCGNWLDPGQTIVTPVPTYSAFLFNGMDVKYSSRIQIIIPNGSSLASSISCILTENDGSIANTQNIESSKFYNMGTNSYIGTFYVLATTNVGHTALYPYDGTTLTIIAN